MKEKVESCFNALRELDLKPTPHNVSILHGVYEILRSLYREMEENNEGNQADPE